MVRGGPGQSRGSKAAESPPAVMGAFLDKPKTEKTNNAGDGNGIAYGIATMQGWSHFALYTVGS